MTKIVQVAIREFVATVATKGFVIGLLITPAMLGAIMVVMSNYDFDKTPEIKGEVAIIDNSGAAYAGIADSLTPEALREKRDARKKRIDAAIKENLPEGVADMVASSPQAEQALEQTAGGVPKLDLVELSGSTDLDDAKAPIKGYSTKTGGRLALVVVHDDAVRPAVGSESFGGYDIYVAKIDERVEDEIRSAVKNSIVDARFQYVDFDRDTVRSLTSVTTSASVEVTERGEQKGVGELRMLIPMGFMILLLVSVMTSGQSLLTSTVEEKSSRVVEVLLSAVSPMQLMAGKILGQFVVGLLVLSVYAALGVGALLQFALFGLIEVTHILYLVIFYLIAYFTLASVMGAIGAAVNEMREAQTLMMPVMLTIMAPWMFWWFIVREPNALVSQVISFIPPVNTFAMMMRLGSASPPPDWQVWLSILVGLVGVVVALWFTGKVFRIGLLMFGKAPDFKTLIRWVRMA